MGISKLTKAAKPQLQRIIKAWCLIVESQARSEGISKHELERQLTGGSKISSPGDFRNFDRWKNSQVPSGHDFRAMNQVAVKKGWIEQDLGKSLVDAFVARSGFTLDSSTHSGWDQIAALQQCLEYGKRNHLSILVEHCSEWQSALDGPDSSFSTMTVEQYNEEKKDYDAIEDSQNKIDEIELELSRLLAHAYSLGLHDPFQLLAKLLKQHKKEWPETVEIYEKDNSSLGKRDSYFVNFLMHHDPSDNEKQMIKQLYRGCK